MDWCVGNGREKNIDFSSVGDSGGPTTTSINHWPQVKGTSHASILIACNVDEEALCNLLNTKFNLLFLTYQT